MASFTFHNALRTALLSLLLGGHAHAQAAADDRIVEVMVDAKKSNCRIVRSWQSKEGETIYQVENLTTQEMLTLVPDDAQGGVRIIHWGPGVKSPPPGTPTPPEVGPPSAATAKADDQPAKDGQVIEVMVDAKKSNCRILRAWQSKEGETLYQVENLATKEMLTLVPDDADGGVRIIHWGPGMKSPPPGTPAPTEVASSATPERTEKQAGNKPIVLTPIKEPRISATVEKAAPIASPVSDVPPLPPIVTGYGDPEKEVLETTPSPVVPPVRTAKRVEREEPVNAPAKVAIAPVPLHREVIVEQQQPVTSVFVPFIPVRPTPVVVSQPIIPEVTIITPGRAPRPETLHLRPVMRGSEFVPLPTSTAVSTPRIPGEFVPFLTTRTSTTP